MGITQKSLDRLRKIGVFNTQDHKLQMLELGCQNIYAEGFPEGTIAREVFNTMDIDCVSWDICGCQGAKVVDLREELDNPFLYDIITDFGTIEHVESDLYQTLKNIHDNCVVEGLMIHENPATGHWEGHGKHYFTLDFWDELAFMNNYEIVELCTEFTFDNFETGGLICCVLKKKENTDFMTKKEYQNLVEPYVFPK